ncbi:hypothetical protein BBJ28_00002196 [Nothophytophthora sp. Chile5]|nr:hypothetical protein BBJ28_00002196 [Nothophytophthora sp. Chile5]
MCMSLYSVENDFSLTPMTKDAAMDSAVDCWEQGDSNDSVLSKQEVRTLSAGEYVLTMTTRQLDRHQAESAVVDATALSPTTVDTNLQLVFDCLDREGRHELSKDDLASFLNLLEHATPASQLGNQTLHDFLRRFGSSARPDSDERSLTLDDLRDVYLNLAAHDDSACRAATGTKEEANRSWNQQSRFKELVWHDLLRLLRDDDDKEGGERDLVDDTEPTIQVDRRELVELVCCIHSDTPLLNVAALPGGKGSLVVNAT